MIGRLDPHSEFLDADAYQRLQDDTEGQFGGLGLVVAPKDGYVTVVAPIEDTPGSRAGILSGDRIVKVDGTNVENAPIDDVVKQLRGEPGTKVSLTIRRPSSGETKDFTLTRAIIQMDMVKDINDKKEFPLGADKIGYVRITQFGDQTGDELESALKKLKAQGMKALVLDLRGNPGGLLDEAVNVCQIFLPRGQPIVSTEGRDMIEIYYRQGRWRRIQRNAHRHPCEPWQRERGGNCHRLFAGFAPRDHSWRKNFWQRLRADDFSARRRLGAQADRRQILHAQPQSHPRARHHAGHHRAVDGFSRKRRLSSKASRAALNHWTKPTALTSKKFTICNLSAPMICSRAFCFTANFQARKSRGEINRKRRVERFNDSHLA